MTMSQKVRDELLQMYGDERKDQKCLITKRLYQEAKQIVVDVDVQIKDVQSSIDKEIELKNNLIETRKDQLRDVNLYGLMYEVDNKYHTCAIEETHSEILAFDRETNTGRREILERK